MEKLKKKISIALIAVVAVSVFIIYQNFGNEDKSKTMTEIIEDNQKNTSEKVNTEKPTETISHPEKEEVKEKPEDMITVTPVKTTGQPIATSKPSEVKKEDDSKKVNTVVKPVVTEKKPTETKKSESTETKKNDTPKSKPTETKPKETSKPSIDDYRGELPDYGGDGPTPASELGEGNGGGTGDASDKF